MKSLIEEQAEKAWLEREALRRGDPRPTKLRLVPIWHPTLRCEQCGHSGFYDQSKPWSKLCPERYTRGCDGVVREES